MSAPWFRCHAFPGHLSVTGRMVETLGLTIPEAVGTLAMLWGAVSVFCENGRINDIPDATLEGWCLWRGEPGKLADFVRGQHTDESGRLNEYDEYGAALELWRQRDKERKRVARAKQKAEKERVAAPQRESVPPPDKTSPETVHGQSEDRRWDVRGMSHPHVDVDVDVRSSTTTSAAARARAREEPSPTGSRPDDKPLPPHVALTVAANHAITARFGEQTRPLLASSGTATAVTERLAAAGIPITFAARVLASWSEETQLPEPPRSLAYFAPVVLEAWEREKARDDAAMTPRAEPLTRRSRASAAVAVHDNALAAVEALLDHHHPETPGGSNDRHHGRTTH